MYEKRNNESLRVWSPVLHDSYYLLPERSKPIIGVCLFASFR